MCHISLFERMRIISLFNQLEIGCRNKYKVVSDLAKNNFGISISAKTVKRWIDRWNKTNKLADRPRYNKRKLLIK
jgi:transposase